MRTQRWKYPGLTVSAISSVLLVATAYVVILDITALRNTQAPDKTVELTFPFKGGVFAIRQGGAGPPQQSTHLKSPAQVYALDIAAVNALGLGRTQLSAENQESWLIWDEPVYSPCAGVVIWARDGIPGIQRIDRETPASNGIAIECNGVAIYLAHFCEGTVRARKGDIVETGQLLGKIGTSGNSVAPHLHIHAEQLPFGGEFSRNDGVAMTFDGRFLWKPGFVKAE